VNAIDLLSRIFKMECSRISMDQLRKHPFVQLDQVPLDLNREISNTDENVDDEESDNENSFNNDDKKYPDNQDYQKDRNHQENQMHQDIDEVMAEKQNQNQFQNDKNENDNNNNNNNNNNNGRNNHRHNDGAFDENGKEGNINAPHVAKVNNDEMESPRNNEGNVDANMTEQIDIHNYPFKSNEAIDFVNQILEIKQEATINDWTSFVNKIELTINKKAQQQQELKEYVSKNKNDARHNRAQEGNNNKSIEEAKLSLAIKELTLLQKYVTDKIV